MRNDWEKQWFFRRKEAADFAQEKFDDSAWECVDLPHDWAIRGPFSPENDPDITIVDAANDITWNFVHPGRSGGLPHVGKGFYRKKFTLGQELPGHLRVEFDGIMANSKIYCNGVYAGGRPYGYSSFMADLTKLVHPGENVLAVEAENYPQASRWYPGGGIYRHTRLICAGRAHIAYHGVRITTNQNHVRISVKLENADGEKVFLQAHVHDPSHR